MAAPALEQRARGNRTKQLTPKLWLPPPCSWIERLFPGLYPRYLHVLRVDPDKMDAVRQGQARGPRAGPGQAGR